MNDRSVAQSNPYLAPRAAIKDITPLGEIELAGRLVRLGASFLDGLIQMLVALPFFFVIFLYIFSIESFEDFGIWAKDNMSLWTVMAVVITVAVFIAINFHLLRSNGQTIGKRICNIKIVRSDGTPADIQRILIYRYLPQWLIPQVPIVGGFFPLIDAVLIFRESRKCLHDDIADTIVIKA